MTYCKLEVRTRRDGSVMTGDWRGNGNWYSVVWRVPVTATLLYAAVVRDIVRGDVAAYRIQHAARQCGVD